MKLDPLCFKNPEFKKLLKVSKISDAECIEDILLSNEWIEFYNNLKVHKGPEACRKTCDASKQSDKKQKLTITRPKTGEVLHQYER